MKKALSFIIAVVMVSLMIPFAALTTVAADEAIYSMDFTAQEANAVTAAGQSLVLPEGWVGTKQEHTTHLSSVSAENGVFLGGLGQGIAMDNRPAVDGAHVIVVKWNTTQVLGLLRIGFTDNAGAAPNEVASGEGTNFWTSNQIVFHSGVGPTVGAPAWATSMEWHEGGYVYGGNVGWTSAATSATTTWHADGLVPSTDIIGNSNGDKIHPVSARMALCQPVTAGADVNTYIVVGEDDTVEAVYMETEGRCIKYLPPEGKDVLASGRLVIWHTGTSNHTDLTNDKYTMNVKSVEYYDSSYEPTAHQLAANVIHSYNFSDAETLADIPYDIVDNPTDAAHLALEDGMLTMRTDNTTSKVEYNKTVWKIDRELFPADGDYTIEYVIDGSSVASYMFHIFDMPETADSFTRREFFNLRFFGTSFAYQSGNINFVGKSSGYTIPMELVAESDIRVQIAIEDNNICGGVITLMTEGGNYSDYVSAWNINPSQYAIDDFGFMLRNDGGEAYVGFKSVAILDNPVVIPDTNSYKTKVDQVVSKDAATGLATVHDVSTVSLAAGEATQRTIENVDGIRFTSTITTADLQTLVDLATENGAIESIEFGTLITTTPWATAAGAVTHEALDAIAGEGQVAYVEVMTSGIDAEDWYATSETVNTFAGTISNVSAEREYQAVGFVRITNSYGNVITVYSGSTTASLASLAQA